MFGLSYLSSEYRRALEILQEKLARAPDHRRRREAELAIQDVLAREKPYTECDLVEADDLRGQLLNKINILSRIGKPSEPFRMHLKDVDFHMQTLQMKESLKEEQRIRLDEPGVATSEKSIPSIQKLAEDRKRKEAFGQRRWQIGFEDEPNDDAG